MWLLLSVLVVVGLDGATVTSPAVTSPVVVAAAEGDGAVVPPVTLSVVPSDGEDSVVTPEATQTPDAASDIATLLLEVRCSCTSR